MRKLRSIAATVVIAGCTGTERVEVKAVGAPIEVSRVTAPVVVAGPSGPVEATLSASSAPLAISGVAAPVAVSGVAAPVAVSGVAAPVTVTGSVGLTSPVEVSAVGAPIRIAEIQSPVAVQLARPELDPERIESGDQFSGQPATCAGVWPCRKLIEGPFIVTDLVYGPNSTNSSVLEYASLFVRAGDPAATSTSRWSLTLRSGAESRSFSSGTFSSGYTAWTSNEVTATQKAITGARFAVRAGEALYLEPGALSVSWSGFRP